MWSRSAPGLAARPAGKPTMPTTRRWRVRERAEGLPAELAEVFLIGRRKSFLAFIEVGGRTPDQLREKWQEHRDVLLRAFVEQHPGRRPWGWWRYDATEPRRVLSGAAAAEENGAAAGASRRGARASASRDDEFWKWHHGVPWPLADAETQAHYLSRLGLLTPAEIRALGRRPRARDEDEEEEDA